MKIISRAPKEMYLISNNFLSKLKKNKNGATIVGLVGDLGSGKTTFVQCVATSLNISDRVTSPTFVIEKIYKIENNKDFDHLIHIDTYRLDDNDELIKLGFMELLKNPSNLIMIEWANKIEKILPENSTIISFISKSNGNKELSWQ